MDAEARSLDVGAQDFTLVGIQLLSDAKVGMDLCNRAAACTNKPLAGVKSMANPSFFSSPLHFGDIRRSGRRKRCRNCSRSQVTWRIAPRVMGNQRCDLSLIAEAQKHGEADGLTASFAADSVAPCRPSFDTLWPRAR